MKMLKNFTVISIIFLLPAILFAQSSLYDEYDKIDKINLKDIDELVKMIQDKEITPSLKARAMNRIAVVYKDNLQELEKQGTLIQTIGGVIEASKNDSQTNPAYMVRSAGCLALRIYDQTSHFNAAIEAIRKPLLEDKHIDVLSSCAHSLGDFTKNYKEATKPLLERLSRDYNKEVRTSEDTRIVSVTVNSLGKLGSKQSFIPLMKVIQSGYPVQVKKEAQTAIDKLRW